MAAPGFILLASQLSKNKKTNFGEANIEKKKNIWR
jgi:hypothetical protein